MQKAKNCYGCPAYLNTYCSLGHELEYLSWGLHRPKYCCHKPKTIKEYFQKLNIVLENQRIKEKNNVKCRTD